MSRLSQIAVRVEFVAPSAPVAPDPGGLAGGVHAILSELAGLLSQLVVSGTRGLIDVRSLPMSSEDRAALQDALGVGEIHVTLDAEGPSQIRETTIPGIWWIEHRNRSGEVTSELIEVALVPGILARAPDELVQGVAVLRERISRRVDARQGRADDAFQ